MNSDSKTSEPESLRQKQAACLECRRSKIKCIRGADESICRRCKQSGSECVVPEYHVGRYKGVKNKRSGLEKAIAQVEQALKKSRGSSAGLDETQAQVLQQLLRETSATAEDTQTPGQSSAGPDVPQYATPAVGQTETPQIKRSVSFAAQSDDSADPTVDNADNPLQLLAIASSIPDQTTSPATPSVSNKTTISYTKGSEAGDNGTDVFFQPLTSALDVSHELDPVSLGLVTDAEAQKLFSYFHESLAHTRWGMDTNVHSASFVRSRSAFLFTSVMAASALFLPDTAALSTRLQNHVKKLAQTVVIQRYRSVEIVLAFMINIPWMLPGQRWAADDDTCHYLSMGLTIALDLMLNRIVVPSSTMRPPKIMDGLTKADCIDASRALCMDGFPNTDPNSLMGKRLLRTRERVWLALFNLDRGVCLARGRPPSVPIGPLVDSCDTWHISDIAERQDGPLVSSTVLRRDFAGLVGEIRSTCDRNRLNMADGSMILKFMKEKIERFFEQWHGTWSFQIQQPDGGLPPYVEILASHTKLAAYCNVIDHRTASADVKQFFRAAGLASAFQVMKVAVQSESRLKSMPNNTVIMLSFAACFALGLSTNKPAGNVFLAPDFRSLIEDVADVLLRIGSTPRHRNGASVLFGKHIKTILRRAAPVLESPRDQMLGKQHRANSFPRPNEHMHAPNNYGGSNVPNNQHDLNAMDMGNFPIFDMTDDQIIQAIANSRDHIDAVNVDFQYEDNQFLNWLESWS